MTDKTIRWEGSELILTPNYCHTRQVIYILMIGFLFLCLSAFLAASYQDYWQLPLAISISLIPPGILYTFFNTNKQIHISGDGVLYMSFSGCFKHEILSKKDIQIVQNILNGKPYMAIVAKTNPYGVSYQVSPFLTNKERTALYYEQIAPAIAQQLNGNL